MSVCTTLYCLFGRLRYAAIFVYTKMWTTSLWNGNNPYLCTVKIEIQ